MVPWGTPTMSESLLKITTSMKYIDSYKSKWIGVMFAMCGLPIALSM